MLLICSAWKNEIAKLEAKFEGKPVVVQTLGIGYLDAALELQEVILQYKDSENPINQIIFLGTAGIYQGENTKVYDSASPKNNLSEDFEKSRFKSDDIVNVQSTSLIHQGKISGSTYVPENLAKEIYCPRSNDNPDLTDFENEWICSLNKSFESLAKAHCFSSLEITKDKGVYDKMIQNFEPYLKNQFAKKELGDTQVKKVGQEILERNLLFVENMELFGVAKVAEQYQIPWSSLLVISNQIHADAHQEWLANHQQCSDKLCDFMIFQNSAASCQDKTKEKLQ